MTKTYSKKESQALHARTWGAWKDGGNTWGVCRAYDKANAAKTLGVPESELRPSTTITGGCADTVEWSHCDDFGNEFFHIVPK
jgi:hypothetical protein